VFATVAYFIMARSKQATPIRREPSSEYVSKQDRMAPGRETAVASKASADANGSADSSQVGKPAAKSDAGVVTLVIDVAGIYASLCANPTPCYTPPYWSIEADMVRRN